MIYQNKVFKKSNLEFDDSISTYDGWGAQQNPNSFEVFHNFIQEVKPKQILEIGTSIGGFTSFLNYTCKLSKIPCDIITYDIHYKSWYEDMKNEGIDVRIENVFLENYNNITNPVIDFVQTLGTTIVLCDGGDKIREFNILSKFLKEGDFILAHDYAENKEIFDSKIYKKIWNWHEIQYSDIENAIISNNLKIYNKDIFENVAWTCWQKKTYE